MTERTNYLNSADTCRRYGVGLDLLRQWRRFANFPLDAVERRGSVAYWDCVKLDAWLKSRPVRKGGAKAGWRDLVNSQAPGSVRPL